MNNLRKLRNKRDISQIELARELNVAQNTISQWELGTRDIDSGTLQKLSAFFGCSIDYLLGETDDPTPSNKKNLPYDEEALEIMEEMHKRPENKVLFSLSRKAKKEDVEAVNELLKHMIKESGFGDYEE